MEKKIEKMDIENESKSKEEIGRLALIVKYSPSLINIASLDGRMTFINEAGEKILGITQKEVQNFSIVDAVSPRLRDFVEKELFSVLQKKGFWEGELEYENVKTKKIIIAYARCFVIKNEKTGKGEFYVNISEDITERKKNEIALEENMAEMERINKLMIGREMKMIELKEKIKSLENKNNEND